MMDEWILMPWESDAILNRKHICQVRYPNRGLPVQRAASLVWCQNEDSSRSVYRSPAMDVLRGIMSTLFCPSVLYSLILNTSNFHKMHVLFLKDNEAKENKKDKEIIPWVLTARSKGLTASFKQQSSYAHSPLCWHGQPLQLLQQDHWYCTYYYVQDQNYAPERFTHAVGQKKLEGPETSLAALGQAKRGAAGWKDKILPCGNPTPLAHGKQECLSFAVLLFQRLCKQLNSSSIYQAGRPNIKSSDNHKTLPSP